MEEVFNKINDVLGGTAVYEGTSYSNDAFYFTYSSNRYTLGIFGDFAILTNISKQDYCRFVTANLTSEIAEAIKRWQA